MVHINRYPELESLPDGTLRHEILTTADRVPVSTPRLEFVNNGYLKAVHISWTPSSTEIEDGELYVEAFVTTRSGNRFAGVCGDYIYNGHVVGASDLNIPISKHYDFELIGQSRTAITVVAYIMVV